MVNNRIYLTPSPIKSIVNIYNGIIEELVEVEKAAGWVYTSILHTSWKGCRVLGGAAA